MDADETTSSDQDDHITLTTPAEAFAELADLNDPEPPSESESPDADSEPPGELAAAPPVVAVVVVHNAGAWLDETLTSLGEQTYANLSVLVIDAASDIDPTPRVADVLPGAFVRRLEHNVGYGPTLNEIPELVSGAAFFCLCHDDVALDPGCIHRLVEEAFRSNAGIVGPKMVDWDDPEVLLEVGFTVDKSGGRAPYAEWGELDQGQHDAVRDVFAVSGGCTLVRADLFEHLGGFDPELDLLGEDLDLCWRAHLVGGRVVVAPRARVRHRQALADRVDNEKLVRVDAAHRIRTTFVNYRFAHLLVLLPQILVISMAEAIVEAAIGRRAHARALLAAWGTNLRGIAGIVRARRRVRHIREHNDRSIRRLQTHTWARLDGVVQAHRRARTLVDDDGDVRDDPESVDPRGSSGSDRSLVGWGIVAVVAVVALGTRELFFGPLPPIGTFARPPGSVGDLWQIWLGSWNPMGLGSAQSPAAGLAPMAMVGSILGGALDLLRRLAILLPIPIGLFGVWHLAHAFRSRRAQLVALVVYAAVPVAWNAIATGRWSGLLCYAAAPWLMNLCARAMHVAPFDTDTNTRSRPWWSRVLGAGLFLAVVGSLVPAIAGVAIVIAIGLAVGSLVTGRTSGLGRLAGVVLGGVAIAAVLLLPWTLVGPARSLDVLAGMRSGYHGWMTTSDLLRFFSGPMGAGILGYGLLLAAGLPLIIGRSWRFRWAVRSWSVALVCWGTLWLGQQRWFDLPIPPPEVLFAPAAAALAIAVGCGMVAIEIDLRDYRFGWAQVVSVGAGVALLIGALPTLGNAADGRWKMAPVGLDEALGPILGPQASTGAFRVVWTGDPDVVPVAGWPVGDRTVVGVTDHGMPTMAELWAPADPEGTQEVADALELAMTGQTSRIGRILADMGVRYLVLPRQVVPLPYQSTAHQLPDRLLGSLDDQLDLARVPANNAVVVYRNDAWKPGAMLWPVGTPRGGSAADALDATGGKSVLGPVDVTGTTTGRLPGEGILAIHQPADPHWRLTVDGKKAQPVTLWGWEQGFMIPEKGRVQLSYESGSWRSWILLVVALAWVLVGIGWFLGRRRGREDELTSGDAVVDADEGSLVRVPSGPDTTVAVAVDEVKVGELEVPERTDDNDHEGAEDRGDRDGRADGDES